MERKLGGLAPLAFTLQRWYTTGIHRGDAGMNDTSLFPYENHPFRLEFGEKKNLSICWFNCEEHLQKHITRYNLKQKEITIHYRDEKPIRSSKKHKKNLQ